MDHFCRTLPSHVVGTSILLRLLLLLAASLFATCSSATETVTETSQATTVEDGTTGIPKLSTNDATTKKAKNPFTNRTWIVTATAPVPSRPVNPFAADTTTEAPLSHWTCFRTASSPRQPVTAADKLACCQQIYRVMQKEPTLCWNGKKGCNSKDHRSAFFPVCQELIAVVPNLSPHTPGSYRPHFQPQFTFVWTRFVSPPPKSWRQCISFSNTNTTSTQWFYTVTSPYELAMDPYRLFNIVEPTRGIPSKGSNNKREVEVDGHFTATLMTEIAPSPNDDRENVERILYHQILPNITKRNANAGHNNQSFQSFSLFLQIFYTLPQGIRIPAQEQLRCRTTCGDSCTLAWSESAPTIVKSNKNQPQECRSLDLVFAIDDVAPHDCKVAWKIPIMLDLDVVDEEAAWVPAPVLVAGQAQALTTNEETMPIESIQLWKSSATAATGSLYHNPLPLDLDRVRDELEPWMEEL
jgi:hypothetical protein